MGANDHARLIDWGCDPQLREEIHQIPGSLLAKELITQCAGGWIPDTAGLRERHPLDGDRGLLINRMGNYRCVRAAFEGQHVTGPCRVFDFLFRKRDHVAIGPSQHTGGTNIGLVMRIDLVGNAEGNAPDLMNVASRVRRSRHHDDLIVPRGQRMDWDAIDFSNIRPGSGNAIGATADINNLDWCLAGATGRRGLTVDGAVKLTFRL